MVAQLVGLGIKAKRGFASAKVYCGPVLQATKTGGVEGLGMRADT